MVKVSEKTGAERWRSNIAIIGTLLSIFGIAGGFFVWAGNTIDLKIEKVHKEDSERDRTQSNFEFDQLLINQSIKDGRPFPEEWFNDQTTLIKELRNTSRGATSIKLKP